MLICFVLLVQHSVYPTKSTCLVSPWQIQLRIMSASQNGPSAHVFSGMRFIVFTFPIWSWSVASFATTDQMPYAGPLNSKMKLTFCCRSGSPLSKLNKGHKSVSSASWFRIALNSFQSTTYGCVMRP